ncbi:MAG: acetyl-CoA carboxylase biotin carboxyl carrier protein [Cyanobacteriota bacterium]
MNIDLEYIKALVNLASSNDLTELKVTEGDKKIIIKKEKETHITQAITPVSGMPSFGQTVTTDSQAADQSKEASLVEGAETKPVAHKKGTPVESPIVGTYYSSPSPDSPPFVTVGSRVKVGSVLCIVESMKLMNEIESDIAGTVIEICVENADPVEANQVIMYIDESK